MTLKNKSLLYSVINGLFLLFFWVYVNQMKTEAKLPISEILDFTNENSTETQLENTTPQAGQTAAPSTIADTSPTISTDTSSNALNQIIDQTSQNILTIPTPSTTFTPSIDTSIPTPAIPIPTPTPTPTPTQPVVTAPPKIPVKRKSGIYNDGSYQATSYTPWGDVSIDMTVVNGRWSTINYLQIPDSPPSQYAASYLANQALAAQGASIDGVSGATYISDAFRDDLSQIVQQSKA